MADQNNAMDDHHHLNEFGQAQQQPTSNGHLVTTGMTEETIKKRIEKLQDAANEIQSETILTKMQFSHELAEMILQVREEQVQSAAALDTRLEAERQKISDAEEMLARVYKEFRGNSQPPMVKREDVASNNEKNDIVSSMEEDENFQFDF